MRSGVLRARRRSALALGFGALLSVNCAAATEQVGQATSVRVSAMQTPPASAAAELLRFKPIFRGAQLSTSPKGALEVTFADASRVSMGGGSTIVVDSYVYAGAGGGDEQVVRYTKGMFRFVSGAISKDKVRLETPTVTIGIRGTVVRTIVDVDGTTTVGVDDGVAFVTSKQSGQQLTLNAGEKVTIKPSGDFGQTQLGKVEGCN